MTRTLRTMLLSATALGALATAAAAASPTMPPIHDHVAGMHSTMDDPVMQTHMTDYVMQDDCPIPTGKSMANMHGNGGKHLGHHTDTPGR